MEQATAPVANLEGQDALGFGSEPEPAQTLPGSRWDWNNSFSKLPSEFFARLAPEPLPAPHWVATSQMAAALVGLTEDELRRPECLAVFSGTRPPDGGFPLAAVYSGHQFGVWAGQLGDGRAILLGEVMHGPSRWELQLKGSGKTLYSRMGDGRAVLRSSIREFLCSEAMAALGIPTTRALCVVGSDLPVFRERVETAAITTRMAPSFVRFGSFEHWFWQDRHDLLRVLADYVIDGFYPELRSAGNPYRGLLSEVTRRTAVLVAQWQAVGFCHGVMNTDNMSILGLTLDYGPFGFMEAFDARYICNHSDEQGRYAYQMQPQIARWNLYCLGQALLPLIGNVEETKAALEDFTGHYERSITARLHDKLGMFESRDDDGAIIEGLFKLLNAQHPDFTLFFRRLAMIRREDAHADAAVRDLFVDRGAFDAWVHIYRARLCQESVANEMRRAHMHRANPKYILRNYLAEQAIRRAEEHDFSEIQRLLKVLSQPFDEQPEYDAYAGLPPDWASGLEVSCSS